MKVISASRRTDIPAFYAHWLVRRFDEGFCHVLNPYSQRVQRVSLLQPDVLAVGLFTRNPRPLVPYLPDLLDRGYRFYAHMTINGYPHRIEHSAPDLCFALDAFRALSGLLGKHFTVWRYDPIILAPDLDEAYHLKRFSDIAQALEGVTRQCVVSFIDPYAKTRRNLAEDVAWEVGERHIALLARLKDVAARHGISLSTCAETEALSAGVNGGACVDPLLISKLRPDVRPNLRLAPTRQGCLCHEAVDIGAYDTCGFGCAYCYATETPQAGQDNLAAHDPSDSVLLRPPALRGISLPLTASVEDVWTRGNSADAGQTLF